MFMNGFTSSILRQYNIPVMSLSRQSSWLGLALFLWLVLASMVRAADTISAAQYLDLDGNGAVDRIRWTMDENVTVCNYEAGDWTVNTAGSITATITGLFCTGANPSLDILVNADANETGGAANPVISYANQGLANSVTLTSGAMSAKASVAATDNAAPVVISRTPSSGAGAIAVDANLVITFSEQMSQADTQSAVSIAPPPGAGTLAFSWGGTDTQLTVNPANDFARATTYVVTLANTASSTATGDPNLATTTWNFTITAAAPVSSSPSTPQSAPAPITTLILKTPNGDEKLKANEIVDLTWASTGTGISSMTLLLSSDGGLSFPRVIAQGEANDGSYQWTVPDLDGSAFRVRIEGRDAAGTSIIIADLSDKNFSIQGLPQKPSASTPTTPTFFTIIKGPPVLTPITSPVSTPGLELPQAIPLQNSDRIMIQGSNTVYLYTADGRRHAFFNEKHYQSWFSDFAKIKIIPAPQLAAIPLGKNMRIRAGTWLVKITSDPKVYAVEPGGLLRWLKTEELARLLYGPNWTQRVIDLDVTVFNDYWIGPPVTEAIFPDGSLIADQTGTYYVEKSQRRRFSTAEIFDSQNRQNFFIIPISNPAVKPSAAEQSKTIGSVGPIHGADGLELLPP